MLTIYCIIHYYIHRNYVLYIENLFNENFIYDLQNKYTYKCKLWFLFFQRWYSHLCKLLIIL